VLTQSILILLSGAALLLLGEFIAYRAGISRSTGLIWSLGLISFGLLFLPKDWRDLWTNNGPGDHFFVLARNVGLTGLLFLLGIRIDFSKVVKARNLVMMGAVAGVLIGFSLAFAMRLLGGSETGALLIAISAIASVSLFIPGRQYPVSKEEDVEQMSLLKAPAVGLSTTMMVAVYSYSVVDGIIALPVSHSALTVAVLYEIFKVLVLFSFAYFVLSRFLSFTEERFSPFRRSVMCLVILALLYVVVLKATGFLGAFAGAFMAGAILGGSDLRERLGGADRPIADALFWSCTFFPLFFQSHGRSWTAPMASFAVVIIALLVKSLVLWIGGRLTGASSVAAIHMTAANLTPGETAIIFLGFGVTKWGIDGNLYFTILSFTAISTLIGIAVWQWSAPNSSSLNTALDPPVVHPKNGKTTKQLNALGILLLIFISPISMTIQGLGATPGEFAVVQNPETEKVSSSQGMEDILEAMRQRINRQADAAELLGKAQRIYRDGEVSHKAGKFSDAETQFIHARQLLLDAGEDQFYEPNVRAFFFEVSHRIAGIHTQPRSVVDGVSSLSTESNEEVKSFIRYYQGQGRGVAQKGLARLGKYEKMMRTIFREEDVPEDLIYVGLVESAYNPYAESAAGAHGMWQFVQETGRRYGLKQLGSHDDRHDPEKSTRAAARYLRDLYEMFGDWPLALAAYNAGEYRIMRIVETTGINDFWEMSRLRLVPQETRNYVAEVFAAIAIGKRNSGLGIS
jgi:Kef-type K+ transport system membrane component KefB